MFKKADERGRVRGKRNSKVAEEKEKFINFTVRVCCFFMESQQERKKVGAVDNSGKQPKRTERMNGIFVDFIV